MSQLSKLIRVTEDEKKNILKMHQTTEEEFEASVNVLKTWLEQNENFPNVTEFADNLIRVGLLNSKLSLEGAKKTIESYFSMKLIHEEIFQRLIPNESFHKVMPYAQHVIMPRLLPNLCRLHISKLTDILGQADTGMDYYVIVFMIVEMRVHRDFFLSNEIMADLSEFNLKTMMKFTPTIVYKLVDLFLSMNLRINKIRILNPTPMWDKILIMFKAIIPSKILDRLVVYHSLEDLHKDIPKEYLPSDYGGTEKSMKELFDIWTNELVANEALFIDLREFKAKKLTQSQQDRSSDNYLGVDGSFKRLSID